jgi:hypothetical protein
MPLTPIKIIISAGAGAVAGADNHKLCERLASIFDAHHIDVDMSLARSGAEVTQLAQDAATGPYKVMVAAGGDGTVNTVAAAAVDSGKILGVLPLGTLNHFARDLKIPFDLEAAAHTIVTGHTIAVDVAEVNNRIFLTTQVWVCIQLSSANGKSVNDLAFENGPRSFGPRFRHCAGIPFSRFNSVLTVSSWIDSLRLCLLGTMNMQWTYSILVCATASIEAR